jgi:hypothetical protein
MVVEAAPGAELDDRYVVRLRGEAAIGVRDSLARVTREGVRLGRRATAEPVYRLVAPEHLRKGLASKTLRHATPARGDASVLVKNAKDGRIAGKADLKRVKPNLIGPAVWQAMALATQQHYLVEISGKLDSIKAGVDEILARLDDEVDGRLNHLQEIALDARDRMLRNGSLSENRLTEVRGAATQAKEEWHKVMRTADRHLKEYRDGDLDPPIVEQSFARLVRATQVLMTCSDALLAVPYRTTRELEDAFEAERDRMMPAIPDFEQLIRELVSASRTWGARQRKYDVERPKGLPKKVLNRLPGVRIGPRTPARAAVSVERFVPFQRLMEHCLPSGTMLVKVLDDGSVLVSRERG